MAEFPTTFAEDLLPLQFVELDDKGSEAVKTLADKGFEVVAGVRRADVPEITAIANQDGVREYCPNDLATRVGDEPMMETWLTKNGGRGAFILRRIGKTSVSGYGWVGQEENRNLPKCESTFAIRIDEAEGGKGLGSLYTTAIVAGSAALYGAKKIGLETWGSNTSAVRAYLKAGAELVTTKDDMRPTLTPTAHETSGMRRDVRLFMQFTHTF